MTSRDIAPAKLNLALHVRGRRPDGRHSIETIFAFCTDGDRLSGEEAGSLSLTVTGPFAEDLEVEADNLALNAARALAEAAGVKDGAALTLDKRLPVASGIGGGSSDAAAALRLLAKLNGLAPDDARLADAALAVGADVPVCLDPRARIMRGIGEILTDPLDLPRLTAVLVNPGVATATRDVFAHFAAMPQHGAPLSDPPRAGMVEFLRAHGNDLTPAALACAPVIGEVLDTLASEPEVLLARMSGSGSTCFAICAGDIEAEGLAERLRTLRPGWWIQRCRLGA